MDRKEAREILENTKENNFSEFKIIAEMAVSPEVADMKDNISLFDINSKQFKRYVTKLKSILWDFCCVEHEPMLAKTTKNLKDYTRFLMQYLISAYYTAIPEERLAKDFASAHGLSYGCMIKDEVVDIALTNENLEDLYILTEDFDTFFELELQAVAKRYIAVQAGIFDIDKTNMITALPQNPEDITFVMVDLINTIWKDMILSLEAENLNAAMLKQQTIEWESKITEAENKANSLYSEIQSLAQRNKELEEKLKMFQEKEKELAKPYQKEISRLRGQYNKLVDAHKTLTDKYNTLKNVEEPEETTEIEENKPNVKFKGERLIFVVDDKDNFSFIRDMTKEFPGSRLVSTNESLNPRAVDGVVILTTRICHTVCNGIKRQCKSRGIPFVYTTERTPYKIREFLKPYLLKEDAL